MRVLGFSERWSKLDNNTFTTFRFQRRDKDWQTGEVVKVVFKPRTREREVLGVAKIIGKGKRWVAWEAQYLSASLQGIATVSDFEAAEDGFTGVLEMMEWMTKTHKDRNYRELMNKLTLEWVSQSGWFIFTNYRRIECQK